MTSSVLPPFSSKLTVVTAPSPLSSLVQTRCECGVTSMYLPKNAIDFEASWPNSKRYLPPTRTSASQESSDTPADFGAHHRLSSSGLVHASNTMRAGPLKVLVTTSSRSDFRSAVVRFFMEVSSPSLLASIDLLRCDEPRLLQDADMLLHAREGHMELLGKLRDRSVRTAELLQNAASGGVRERGERGIEAGPGILTHKVQYLTRGWAAGKGSPWMSAPKWSAPFGEDRIAQSATDQQRQDLPAAVAAA